MNQPVECAGLTDAFGDSMKKYNYGYLINTHIAVSKPLIINYGRRRRVLYCGRYNSDEYSNTLIEVCTRDATTRIITIDRFTTTGLF